MEIENSVTRSVIDELCYSEIQGDQTEAENSVTPSIIDELVYWDIQ